MLGVFVVWLFLKGLDERSADQAFYIKTYDAILTLKEAKCELTKGSAQVAMEMSLRDTQDKLFRKYGLALDCRIQSWSPTNTAFWIINAGEDKLFGTGDDSSNLWALADFGKAHGLYYSNAPSCYFLLMTHQDGE